jgi:hypothetical protein
MTIAFNNQYVLFDSHDFQFFGVYTDGLYKYQECQKERRDGSHLCLVGLSNDIRYTWWWAAANDGLQSTPVGGAGSAENQ